MKALSVSQIKGMKVCRNSSELPRAGGRTREAYDLFMANKGVPIVWDRKPKYGRVLPDLVDYFGLDIRCIQKGNSRTCRPSKYVLAGEWFGKVYVDYIAEHLERAS